MLLHDTYFILLNDTSNIGIHSPLFESSATFIVSLIGLFCNLSCCIKLIYLIKYTNNNQKSQLLLSDSKYYFFIALTLNEFLLCLSSVISCLDEKYYSFLSKYHLCSLHAFLWKFTLHFTPLLIITILSRYHYLLNYYKHYSRSFNQLFCTNLSILLPFILSLSWSVDGLWLWGVTNIKDFKPKSGLHITLDGFLVESEKFIAFLIGLLLGIWLQCRLSYRSPLDLPYFKTPHERHTCLYVLHTFLLSTITSFPFFLFRTYEIIADYNLSDLSNFKKLPSRLFAQILIAGVSCKPILFLVLFCPFSRSFLIRSFWTYYIHCFPPNILKQNQVSRIRNEQSSKTDDLENAFNDRLVRSKSINSIIAMTASNSGQCMESYSLLIPSFDHKFSKNNRCHTLSVPNKYYSLLSYKTQELSSSPSLLTTSTSI
ncbi:unnamed protein product [Didymodactylos carnosus]|uniref:Uncharacterized protein n=1 Tax=Didymodactylos carnosus TaxID=1234261 RepID=A0A814ZW66_9BILA|nr:unnamed protein product [Didymodactylos carnosus]CAF4014766.1 unnamed protein product [Didymodactylos carnosus]